MDTVRYLATLSLCHGFICKYCMQHAAIIVKFLQDAKIFAIIFCVQHTEIIADIPAC